MRPLSSLVALGAGLVPVLSGRAVTVAEPPPPPAPVHVEAAPADPTTPPALPWALAMTPIRFLNTRTGAACQVRVYAGDGALDAEALAEIDRVAAERDDPPRPLDRRVVRLVVKAASHFHAAEVALVSTFRDRARGGSRHRSGEAVDFRLPGVTAARLAAHLREGARVGVGVYPHPRTQFVHLDVREQSFHWADASPPGRVWRETPLTDRGARMRDEAYAPEQDLPGWVRPAR